MFCYSSILSNTDYPHTPQLEFFGLKLSGRTQHTGAVVVGGECVSSEAASEGEVPRPDLVSVQGLPLGLITRPSRTEEHWSHFNWLSSVY